MIEKMRKVNWELLISLSIPILAIITGVCSLVTAVLLDTQNMTAAMLYCAAGLSGVVLLWWTLSCILALRYVQQIRNGNATLMGWDEAGTLLLPRFMRNAALTLGGVSLGLGAILSPAQALEANNPYTPPTSISAVDTTAAPKDGTLPSETDGPFYSKTQTEEVQNTGQVTLSPFFGGSPETSNAATYQGKYIVLNGDNLWDIAQQQLGAEACNTQIFEYMMQLYRANRAVIGDNPSYILPGQQLILPAT